ncbi:MAG: MBL fold metallo-hydrolase [Deltaproteobacteria bacterium]|nr:MBL fold metallo-hydrolase [Deltaproteobacteria bacterium]
MFGNVPRALWSRWITPDDQHRIPLACRAMLIEEPARRILVEAGIGACFDPKARALYGVVEERHMLLDNLAALGLAADDIDVIVLSHLHFDHAGGLLTPWAPDAAPALAFPRAAYVVGRRAWERALAPHPRDRASFLPALQPLLAATGRLELVDGATSATLGPDHRLHLSEGHTPGLMLVEVPSADGPIVFVGDLVPGRAWVHLPVTMGYDRFPELLVDEKRALFEDLHARGGRLFFTHDDAIALGRIARDDKGRWTTSDVWPAPVRLPLDPPI